MSWQPYEILGAIGASQEAVARELHDLRKQAAIDRQTREASQAEFARLNREVNEAKDRARDVESMHAATLEVLGEERWRIGKLLDEIASTAIAAGMMDPTRRDSLDGPNAIQFLRQIKTEYEARRD